MEGYFQTAAAVLLAVILGITLKQTNPPMAMLLSLAVCALAIMTAFDYLKPVLDFLERLQALGNLPGDLALVLLKVTGIAVVTEIAALVCSDSGNSSLGQTLKLLGSGVILYLSIPVFQVLLDLIQEILEGGV